MSVIFLAGAGKTRFVLKVCRHVDTCFVEDIQYFLLVFFLPLNKTKTKKMGGKNKKEKKSSDIANNRFLNLSSVSLLSTLTIETEPARMEEGKRSSVGYFFVTSDRLWYF